VTGLSYRPTFRLVLMTVDSIQGRLCIACAWQLHDRGVAET